MHNLMQSQRTEDSAPEAVKLVIRPFKVDDVAAAYELLRTDFGWQGGDAAFQRLVDQNWSPADLPRGMVVTADGRLVGFIATIFSPWPRTDDVALDVAARTSWLGSFSFYHVLPSYRAGSLPLLRAALKLADRWTSLTPNLHSQAILKMAGFRVISDGFRFFWRGTVGWRRGGWRAARATSEQIAAAGLERMCRDHEPYGCKVFVASRAADTIVVVTRRRLAGSGLIRVPTSEVLFVSEVASLHEAWPALCATILWHDRSLLVALDDCFDPQRKVVGGISRARSRMARGLTPDERPDALYSELVLLS